nr:acid phosphatase [uncultured Albidiferax sp.]
MRMLFRPSALAAAALLLTACSTPTRQASAPDPQLAQIGQIVVVYLENRSFDHLFGLYPGANGVPNALAQGLGVQVDANNQPYAVLPPPLADKTGKPDARLAGPIPNGPFRLDPKIGLGDTLFSPIHAFWANQRQINGGRNDRFVADGNSGGLLMGTYDGSSLGLWKLAQRFTLADNFFQSAFGGSFLNHFWLVCACTPVYANAPHHIVALDAQGRSAEPDEPEAYVTQDGYAVNTMQGSWLYDPTKKQALLPPQTAPTIGDRLSDKGIPWAYYGQDFNRAVAATQAGKGLSTFSYHHQPFIAFKRFIDSEAQRKAHLKDRADFMADAQGGTLPPVSFYKPTGGKNMHPGRGSVAEGDAEATEIVNAVMAGPQWKNTVVIVTTDENGGFWDHAAPPKGDRWGPGSRIPAIIVSPFSEGGRIDHTQYETVSILKLIEDRFGLAPLGSRDAKANSLAKALKF